MTRFRYLGDREHIYLGPPVRVMSPGDVVDLTSAPDPAMFEPVPDPSDQDPSDQDPSDQDPSDQGPSDQGSGGFGARGDGVPAAAGGEVAEPAGSGDETSGPDGAPDGDVAAGTGGEPR